MYPAELSPFFWITACCLVVKGLALRCYECRSTENPDCGPHFRHSPFEPVDCPANATKCGLQRQQLDPARKQVAGIARGCYVPGFHVSGLNDTNGCRDHTTADKRGPFTALYCFCDTDLCNGGVGALTLPACARWGIAALAALHFAAWRFLVTSS